MMFLLSWFVSHFSLSSIIIPPTAISSDQWGWEAERKKRCESSCGMCLISSLEVCVLFALVSVRVLLKLGRQMWIHNYPNAPVHNHLHNHSFLLFIHKSSRLSAKSVFILCKFLTIYRAASVVFVISGKSSAELTECGSGRPCGWEMKACIYLSQFILFSLS